jgi:hypothetical protein
MIPHAATSSASPLSVATVFQDLWRPPISSPRGPRCDPTTGPPARHPAVDVTPKAAPVDDELVVAVLAGDYQPLQKMTSAERKTGPPVRLHPESNPLLQALHRGLGLHPSPLYFGAASRSPGCRTTFRQAANPSPPFWLRTGSRWRRPNWISPGPVLTACRLEVPGLGEIRQGCG